MRLGASLKMTTSRTPPRRFPRVRAATFPRAKSGARADGVIVRQPTSRCRQIKTGPALPASPAVTASCPVVSSAAGGAENLLAKRSSPPQARSARRGQAERFPHVDQRVAQMLDHRVVMEWRGGDPKPFGTARHRGIVDRLDIDAMLLKQMSVAFLQRSGLPTSTGTICVTDGMTGSPAALSTALVRAACR